MKTRFISAQVLLNKDMSMKAQRVYAIPQPAVVSFYLDCVDYQGEKVNVGVMVQDWNTRDVLDGHPDSEAFDGVLLTHFGLLPLGYENV